MDPIIPDSDGQTQQVKQLNAAQVDAEQGSNYAEQAGLTGPAAPKPAPQQAASWGALVKDHPVLSQHLVDRSFANAAKDDIPQLSKIERLFGGWDEMMWKTKLNLEDDSRNQRLAAIGRAQKDGSATPEMLKEADELEKQAASVKEPNIGFVPGIVPATVGVLPGLTRALPTAAAYGVAGAIGGVLLTKNPRLAVAAGGAMAGAGFTVGMAMDTARTEQGLAYRQYIKAGADPKTAAIAADLVALGNGGLQAIPAEKIFNLVPGISNLLAGKKTRDLVSALITSNTGRAALQRFALRAGESGLLMALVGGGQELVRELGALGAGADDQLHGGRIWDAATGGLQQGLGFGLGHAIAPFIGERREAQIGQARGEMYRAISNESKNSKLREQMPEAFKNYVNAVIAEHGNVEEAKAPAEKLTSLLQKEGVTQEQLEERMPDVAKQLKNATPKDEIVIPMGDLATHLAPLKSFDEFSQDLRVGDDALTPRESKKIGELADKFEKEQPAAKEGEEVEPGRKVYDDVYTQLTEAGQAPEVAQKDAALWAAFATARGERLGVDPFDYYKSRAVSVGTEFPDAPGTTLGQREKRLIVQHNLSEDNLRHIEEALGGYMPAPSIGIAKKEHPLSSFGEITLLAKPELIDPAKGVPVKGADIYSTRHPRPRFKVNEKNLRSLMTELKPSKDATGGYTADLEGRVNEYGVDAALRDRDVRKVFEHAFLKEQGVNLEGKTRDVPLFQSDIAKTKAMKEFFEKNGIEGNHEFGGAYHKGLSDAVQAAIREVAEKLPEEDREDYVKLHDEWFGISKDDKGLIDFSKTWKFVQDAGKLGKQEIDPYAMEDLVRKKVEEIGTAKFEKWAKEKIKSAVGEPYIRKFSENTGNEIRRTYTVDNILREMTKKLARGEANMYGFGWARAEGAPRFRSIEAIQKADKTIIPSAEFEKIKDSLNDEGASIGTKLSSLSDNPSAFGSLDSFVEAVAESYRRGHYLSKELELSGFKNVPPELLREIQAFADKLKNAPTEYFEAKPQRAVHLSEFQAAVVPESASKDARAILEKHGLKIYDYKYQWNAERERRENVIAKAAEKENILFQSEEAKLAAQIAEFGPELQKKLVSGADIPDDQLDKFLAEEKKRKPASFPTEEEIRAAIAKAQEFYQRGGAAGTDGYRGKISFDDARSYFNITLTGKANLSTFLHESGHAFFEFMRKDAESGHAQSAEDFGKLLEWMGVKAGEQPSTEQLEQFARGFEGYLMEGKAPAPELRGLFRTFASWLKQVYRGMKNLGVTLTDDVRGVMDRMLATDKEIEKAKEGLGLEPMKKPEGMSDAEYKAYTEKFGKAMEAGRNELEEMALKEFRNTIGEERAKTQADVDAATRQDPAHNAYEVLRTGKRLDGGEAPEELAGKKLDREAVAEAGHKGIKWANITAEGGLDPDIAAPLLGYENGPALLEALEARRSRSKEIKEETERRMMDKYPNAELAKMSEQAVKALHLKDDVGNVLWLEAKAIGKQVGADDPRTARAVVKEIARRRTSEMTALEMQPGRFARGEERAAGEWADAMKAKDFAEAHKAKLEQILNHEMFKAVSEAKEEIDSIRSYLDGFNELPNRRRLGKAGQSYLNAVDAIISDIELKRQTNKTLQRRASLESYLAEMENEDGALIAIPAELRSEAALKNYKQMTLDDLRAVHDAVSNIETMARLKNKLFDGRERRNFQETAVRASQEIRANLGNAYAEKKGAAQNPGWYEKKKIMFRESRAEKKMMEFVAREFDGGKTAGMIHDLIFQPFATAEAKKHELTKKITEELMRPLREMTFKERLALDRTVDFLGTPMKMRDVIAVALNMGNNGNKKKLLEGYGYRGWNEEKVIGRLGELLTDKHVGIIDHFWKTIGSLWPEIKALSERTTGVAPPKVEAAKLTIRGRELEGGYYPIVYDRERSYKAEQIAQRKGDLFENNFLKPGVSKGFTEARTQFAAPILLSLNVIPSHINEVVHYLTHLEPVRAVDRLLAHGEMRTAITEGAGREVYNLFRPWLQRIAHAGTLGLEHETMIDKGLRWLRVGNTLNRFGFKMTAGLMQTFNIFSSMKELGGIKDGTKYLGLGMKRWMEDVESFRDPFGPLYEKSPDIAGKAQRMERELLANFDHFTSAFSEFGHMKEQFGHFAMSFFTHIIRTVDALTWYGAREKAFAENHPRPEEFADSVVRLSQMGEGVKDKAAIMFGGEGSKLFVGMYSWYSVVYNQLTEQMPQSASTRKKVAEYAARWWWMVLAPSVAMAAIKGKGPEKDRDEATSWAQFYGEEMALEGTRAWPIVGLAAETAVSGHEGRWGVWIPVMIRGIKARAKMVKGEPLSEREKTDIIRSTGIMGRLPADGLWNAYKYASAVQDGKLEEPIRDLLFRSPGEWK